MTPVPYSVCSQHTHGAYSVYDMQRTKHVLTLSCIGCWPGRGHQGAAEALEQRHTEVCFAGYRQVLTWSSAMVFAANGRIVEGCHGHFVDFMLCCSLTSMSVLRLVAWRPPRVG
jgi:hypothetical protein